MTEYTNFEHINIYLSNGKGNYVQLNLQSFLQLNFIETIQPYFGFIDQSVQGFLQGKHFYPGKIQFNQQNMHPLMYYHYNEGRERGITILHDNYVIQTPIMEVVDQKKLSKTILENVFFIGYQLETTPDGQPVQIAHNLYFMDYQNF